MLAVGARRFLAKGRRRRVRFPGSVAENDGRVMGTRRARRINRRRMRYVGLLIAGTAALGMTGATVAPAFAAGGHGESFCSVATGPSSFPGNPGHAVQVTGNPLIIAEICNPLINPVL